MINQKQYIKHKIFNIISSNKITSYYTLFSLPLFFLFFLEMLNQDFRFLSYDSEPDYIMNALNIIHEGIPLACMHPGTISFYIVSLLIKIALFLNLTLTQTIIFIRSLLILFWGIIFLIINKGNWKKAYLVIIATLTIPHLKFCLSTIGAEIFLFPLGLILSHSIKNDNIKIFQIGIMIGIGLSIKLSFLLIFPFLVLYLLGKASFYDFCRIFVLSIITLVLLEMPVFPQFLLLLNRILFLPFYNFNITIFKIIHDIFGVYYFHFTILIIVLSSFLFALLMIRKKDLHSMTMSLKKSIYKNSELLSKVYILTLFFYFMVISIEYPLAIRHCIILIPFVLEYLVPKKKYFDNQFIILVNFVIFCVLIFKPIKSIDYNEKTPFDKYAELKKDKTIVTIMNGIFNSEYLFKAWADYRYGNSRKLWGPSWTYDLKTNIQFLNTRNLNCKLFLNYDDYSFFEHYLSPHRKRKYSAYYPICIDDQISSIIRGDSEFITFNNIWNDNTYSFENEREIKQVKNILLDKGFEMKKMNFKEEFTVWTLERIN